MRIRWAENAHRDLVDIREYIARDSLYYARQFTERLIAAVERLTDHARIGPVPRPPLGMEPEGSTLRYLPRVYRQGRAARQRRGRQAE